MLIETLRKITSKSIFGIIFIGCVCLAMTGFGIGSMMQGNRDAYAIKVNESSIDYSEVANERRALEERYRRMFGENFEQFSKALNLNLNQQAVDKLIGDTLLREQAEAIGLYVGKAQVQNVILTEVFPQGFDKNQYAQLIRQLGYTAEGFEKKVKHDALRAEIVKLLSDAALPSRREVLNTLQANATTYDLRYVTFDPKDLSKDVTEPTDAECETYYKEHQVDFQVAPRVSYDYLILDPEKYSNLVEVFPEDVELYYTDHEKEFQIPAAIKARHIQLTYTADATPEEMVTLKEKAQEVAIKARAGEAFESLVAQYSDDIPTKTTGGDVGWITRGKMSKEFDDAAFDLAAGQISDVVQASYGFHIIKVEETRPAQQRELSEVKSDIESIIRRREAPAYTSEKGRQLLDQWQKSALSLKDLAAQEGVKAESVSELLFEDKDPAGGPSGLTAKVLAFPEETKQLVDLDDKTILVAVTAYREEEISTFAEVKENIRATLKNTAAKELAQKKSQEFVEALKDSDPAEFTKIAAAKKYPVTEAKKAGKDAAAVPFIGTKEARAMLNGIRAPLNKPDRSIEADGKYFVFQVTGIAMPAESELESQFAEAKTREGTRIAQDLVSSVINRLKSQALIDVRSGVITE